MKKSINYIIIGILLTMFDLFIDSFNLLPNALAYYFVFIGIGKLKQEVVNDSFTRIHTYSAYMILYALFTDFWNTFSIIYPKPLMTIFISIISLLLFFVFFYYVILSLYTYFKLNVEKDKSIRNYIINGLLSITLIICLMLAGLDRFIVLIFIITAQLKLLVISMLNKVKNLKLDK